VRLSQYTRKLCTIRLHQHKKAHVATKAQARTIVMALHFYSTHRILLRSNSALNIGKKVRLVSMSSVVPEREMMDAIYEVAPK
jgi:hypothetical protein